MTASAAAFYDVDGTIVEATIVHYYVFLKTRARPQWSSLVWKLLFLPRIPWYWLLDQVSREQFNRSFYYNYRGFSEEELRTAAGQLYREFMGPRVYPAARRCIEGHQARGEDVVFVTGSLRPLVSPLARELGVTEVLAAEPEAIGGVYTGRLAGKPLTGSRKAEAVNDYISRHQLERRRCFAYGDSADDLSLLESVGRPRAVNPDRGLGVAAAERGWEVLNWTRSDT